jgi:hypothetical protein
MIRSIIVLIMIFSQSFCQNNDEKIGNIDNYCDSLDCAIENSSGLPGEIFCNKTVTKRNVRAIGMQETEIRFYFIQKEDSVYEDGNTVRFIQQHYPPLKIQILYNIAASQNVIVSYYFTPGSLNYYSYKSGGAYGNEEKLFWFDSGQLLKAEWHEDRGNKLKHEMEEPYTLQDKQIAEKILKNSSELNELYNVLFRAETIDK